MAGYNFGKILSINVPERNRGNAHVFLRKKRSNWSKFYYLEHGLYNSFTDVVEAMNTLILERHNHS